MYAEEGGAVHLMYPLKIVKKLGQQKKKILTTPQVHPTQIKSNLPKNI